LFGQADDSKYLELTEPQLRDIGFVINEKGIFFKSEIPSEDAKKYLTSVRGYLNTPDDRGTIHIFGTEYEGNEKHLKDKEKPVYFDSLNPVKCDYYFVKIIEIGGDMICDVDPHKAVTIPIVVRQTKYDFQIKKDVIFYMIASEGLRKKLSFVDNLNQYIVTLKGE